jgi:hypothetical protein
MTRATPQRDISAALHAAFLQELAAKFPGGRSPAGHRFEDGRWFAGASPTDGDPLVVFGEDNIMVGDADGRHEHFFPGDDTVDAHRTAARQALDSLLWRAELVAAPPRSPSRRAEIGAARGAVCGAIIWIVPFALRRVDFDLVPFVVGMSFLVMACAVVGAVLLRPPR